VEHGINRFLGGGLIGMRGHGHGRLVREVARRGRDPLRPEPVLAEEVRRGPVKASQMPTAMGSILATTTMTKHTTIFQIFRRMGSSTVPSSASENVPSRASASDPRAQILLGARLSGDGDRFPHDAGCPTPQPTNE
jgi:hypothetical protein